MAKECSVDWNKDRLQLKLITLKREEAFKLAISIIGLLSNKTNGALESFKITGKNSEQVSYMLAISVEDGDGK